jgi:hypothetical protein
VAGRPAGALLPARVAQSCLTSAEVGYQDGRGFAGCLWWWRINHHNRAVATKAPRAGIVAGQVQGLCWRAKQMLYVLKDLLARYKRIPSFSPICHWRSACTADLFVLLRGAGGACQPAQRKLCAVRVGRESGASRSAWQASGERVDGKCACGVGGPLARCGECGILKRDGWKSLRRCANSAGSRWASISRHINVWGGAGVLGGRYAWRLT